MRQGRLTSAIAPLASADVAVPNRAFKRVVRELEFDVAELALMTLLMADLRSSATAGASGDSWLLTRPRRRGRCRGHASAVLSASLPVAQTCNSGVDDDW